MIIIISSAHHGVTLEFAYETSIGTSTGDNMSAVPEDRQKDRQTDRQTDNGPMSQQQHCTR